MPTLGSTIVAQDLLIQKLLKEATIVGGIYTMGFDQCLVLTNDLWKHQAGGIPQHCFLLATAMAPGEAPDPDDEEVLLLRVVGPAILPSEAELVQVRADAMRQMVTNRGTAGAAESPAVLDVLTRNEIQFSAMQAKVLGTFYDTDVNGTPLLAFGSDIETFYSASRYKVYKPHGSSLSIIASYPEITDAEERERQRDGREPGRLRIGAVRYSSANRRHRAQTGAQQDADVPVRVNIEDFIALKTAVFGMTRLGKSNTMKTIATAIAEHAGKTGQRIGQLLFDPAGEYANVNVQDQTALSQVGTEFVTIYRFGATGEEEGVRPLSINFFSDATIGATWSMVYSYLRDRIAGTNYIASFVNADVVGPADPSADISAAKRAARRRAALYATFLKANFRAPNNLQVTFAANKNVVAAVNTRLTSQQEANVTADRHGNLHLDAQALQQFWDALYAVRTNTHVVAWLDTELEAILAVYSGTVGSGFRILEPLRVFHASEQQVDYATQVLQDLIEGKIVIVDFSRGSEAVLQFSAERIVNHIITTAAQRFAAGQPPYPIQIYLEEAHRLFSRDKFKTPTDADPYVRLAKEAAKYKIGLVYATQEVSSVDPYILSNTSNWVVTHLNNHAEVRELSKYYEFQDFADLTLRAEDVGFVRLKTRSGRYIIPTQIDLFSEARVQDARAALLSTQAPGTGN